VKIGLIADTHIPEAGHSVPEQVRTVFKEVELILHAGDLHILLRFTGCKIKQEQSFRRKPESSKDRNFWMPDQVRHDDNKSW